MRNEEACSSDDDRNRTPCTSWDYNQSSVLHDDVMGPYTPDIHTVRIEKGKSMDDYSIHGIADVKRELDDREALYYGQDHSNGLVEPGFSTVSMNEVDTAWGTKTVEVKFTDPLLHGYSVLIVSDTVPEGYDIESDEYINAHGIVPERITTMVMRFPRCILPEVNTHRVFSRNSASSRARSFKTTIRPIMEDAYVPLFTENKKGMGGDWVTAPVYSQAAKYWLEDRDMAVWSTLRMLLGDDNMLTDDGTKVTIENIGKHWEPLIDKYMTAYRNGDTDGMPSIHKQNANRLIEPFMWHEALVTSTYWSNFLNLRINKAAQPEITALAILVRHALMYGSTPKKNWVHLPFGNPDALPMDDWGGISDSLLMASSECARISYKDRSNMGNRDDVELGRKLLEQKHMSPFEHIAFDLNSDALLDSPVMEPLRDAMNEHGVQSNLSPSWLQYRRVVSAKEQ